MTLVWIIGIALLCACILIIGVFADMKRPENAVRSDCIIVPGCKVTDITPSRSLQSRLDCALRLYRDGYAKIIIVCGALGGNGFHHRSQSHAQLSGL